MNTYRPGARARRHVRRGGEQAVSSFPPSGIREIAEAYLGDSTYLPSPDLEGQLSFLEEYFRAGAPELMPLYRACLLSLRVLSVVRTGRTFSRLSPEGRQRLLTRLMASRNPLVRGVAVLAGMPLYMSYYRRPEVSVLLGFDPRALKEEANLRVVTRDRQLPPREETP